MVDRQQRSGAKRRQLFVDAKIQGALLLRAFMYWVFCLMTVTLLLLSWRIVAGPARLFNTRLDELAFHFGPALIASFVLLPIVLVDVVKLSNKFVGPLVRLRRSLRLLAQGKPVEPIHFRDGDYWQEIAEEFNAVIARLEQERAERQDHAEASLSG